MELLVDLFKNPMLFEKLKEANQTVIDVIGRYKGRVHEWFDPARVKYLWSSKSYPNPEEVVIRRSEYSLALHACNYLCLFLSDLLYPKRKGVVIEDFGCGDGRLFVYLHLLGFKKFSAWDNWTQISKYIYDDMMLTADIKPKLNIPSVNPTIVNNSGAPFLFIAPGFDDRDRIECGSRIDLNEYRNRDISKVELITFYNNRHWENELAPKFLTKRGFRFLCRDGDDLAVAWCREDKFDDFVGVLNG